MPVRHGEYLPLFIQLRFFVELTVADPEEKSSRHQLLYALPHKILELYLPAIVKLEHQDLRVAVVLVGCI